MQILTIDNRSGRGYHDYTRYWVEPESFFTHELNQPQKFEFMVQDLGDPNFEIPSRGSYVVFEDSRWESRDIQTPDSVIFTGYITDEPKPVFLGTNNETEVWGYQCTAVSEDYLPQVKELPVKTYVNKTRGFIIRDIIAEMFKTSDKVPLDTTGVQDGGVERLFQTERTKKFTELLFEFGKADGYRYRVLHGKLFYEPETEFLPSSNDPLLKLQIDTEDPRFTPHNLDLNRVATNIVNDVTVFGEEEPTTLVTERYISDGYQGEHQLLFRPHGVTEKILVDDDFTAPSFDTSIWQEADDELALTGLGDGSYLQLFEGSFNIVGGPTTFDVGFINPAAVYLRSRRGIELSGIIDFRDGEIFFGPAPTGAGIIGGLFPEESTIGSNCFSGWVLKANGGPGGGPLFQPLINGVVQAGIEMDPTLHYILRRRFEFDIPVGLPVIRRGPLETDVLFGDVDRPNGCWVTYKIEQIDATDPQNVITTSYDVLRVRIENCPEFVLYTPVVSYDLHVVMNFCKVWRPQQVRLYVNGAPHSLGDFIDGGVATISVEDERAKLQWYSVPTSVPNPPSPVISPAVVPFAFWKLGDSSIFIEDYGATKLYPMNVAGPISLTTGAPSSSIDQARQFPGDIGPTGGLPEGPNIFGPLPGGINFTASSTGGFPVPFSVTGWVKTTTADGPIFVHQSPAYGYVAIWVSNGRISARLTAPEYQVTGSVPVNDGAWHHFAVTHNAMPFQYGTTDIYVDGVKVGSGEQIVQTPQSAWAWKLGYDNARWDSLSTHIQTWYKGALDEIALWEAALTATEVDGLYKSSQAPPTTAPPPAYNPQTGVTIPPQGSIVEITYYRADEAKARVISNTSILTERAKFGDDGVRQHTILADEVFPTPRTSEECQFLAQAYLADRERPRYEGSYTFETGERDVTRLDIFPAPGDLIPTNITLPDGEVINQNLLCTNVTSQFIGEGAYSISLSFGPRSRFDQAQRKLMLARKSSLDGPEIKDNEVLVAEVLNTTGYEVPADPTDVVITGVTPLTFTVAMNAADVEPGGFGFPEDINSTLPEGVVGYEIRRDDTGWGQPNYVARVHAATFTLNRGARDRAYFIRPFNNQNIYSRHSALVRVISPLSNTLAVTGLDGDISPEYIRLFIPLQRNPDIGGYLVQKDNLDGVILYQGDGVLHKAMISGANILVESSKITLTIPNTINAASFTVRVLIYNLLNEFGPETIFTITRPAETL